MLDEKEKQIVKSLIIMHRFTLKLQLHLLDIGLYANDGVLSWMCEAQETIKKEGEALLGEALYKWVNWFCFDNEFGKKRLEVRVNCEFFAICNENDFLSFLNAEV